HGAALAGARVRVSSPALLGGPITGTTNERGQLRVPAAPPGSYLIDVEFPGFDSLHVEDVRIGMGATIEHKAVLRVAGVAESIVVEGERSDTDTRDPGLGTRFGPGDLDTIPTRRASMFDFLRAVPGVSPTSPSSGTVTTVSVFGSGTNENQFLIDGTNFTCPCSGVARAEPVLDFIQAIHVQSIGASAEFGNLQGGVINVVTKHGGDRYLGGTGYYAQLTGLTSQPVRLPVTDSAPATSGYERIKYHDFTTSLGGPLVKDRLWFFAGYQYLRDYDSQPGTNPDYPRTYEQDNVFGKLTWRLAPDWQLVQSVQTEFWVNPVRPTVVTPFEATIRPHGTVPAITFGHLTHTASPNMVWDVRVGRFVHAQRMPPSTGDTTTASRRDRVTGVTSGAPPSFGEVTISRTTAKATLSRYDSALGADHQWKIGAQLERGEHDSASVIPTGVRYVDSAGAPFQAVYRAPVVSGGRFTSAAAFVSDTITVGARLTLSAGVRFDHTRAESQDLPALDAEGREADGIIPGLGHLYTWNIVSPRLGATLKIGTDGLTLLRASYGRFSQGVLTGEFEPFHPGVTPTTTAAYDPAAGGYTRIVSVVDPSNLRLDGETRAPRTDEYSIGLDRKLGGIAVAAAYVRKRGDDFIGWTDEGGQYQEEVRTLPDGRTLPVFRLINSTADRRFVLTNPEGYSLSYDGVVFAVEKRRSGGWQASGSYTLSKTRGLMASSGTTASGPQVSTVGPPIALTFGRDPNDLTNARGRLPNDRPHVMRVMGSVDVPRTGLVVSGNLQYFSGKPWAATTQIVLPQGDQRILIEPRGSRRLASQTLLDIRVSRAIASGRLGRIELMVDLLNALNDTAEESLATDNFYSPTFGQPTVFIDPRRAMVGARIALGR
ncbi:MAG TPA: TonB-dependent receptor, partial [Vicinamibacterales bacterium]|nr:TonB-dependent receptor [Vicinamibacterales bacterium]